MSVTSSRNIQVSFSGDLTFNLIQSAVDNLVSVAVETFQNLVSGNNVIISPQSGSLAVTALTIIPPSGNTHFIILKGDTPDVGIPIHKTDPTTIALDPGFSSLVLNTNAIINGIRLIWS